MFRIAFAVVGVGVAGFLHGCDGCDGRAKAPVQPPSSPPPRPEYRTGEDGFLYKCVQDTPGPVMPYKNIAETKSVLVWKYVIDVIPECTAGALKLFCDAQKPKAITIQCDETCSVILTQYGNRQTSLVRGCAPQANGEHEKWMDVNAAQKNIQELERMEKTPGQTKLDMCPELMGTVDPASTGADTKVGPSSGAGASDTTDTSTPVFTLDDITRIFLHVQQNTDDEDSLESSLAEIEKIKISKTWEGNDNYMITDTITSIKGYLNKLKLDAKKQNDEANEKLSSIVDDLNKFCNSFCKTISTQKDDCIFGSFQFQVALGHDFKFSTDKDNERLNKARAVAKILNDLSARSAVTEADCNDAVNVVGGCGGNTPAPTFVL